MRWLDGARTRLRLLFGRGAAERRMDDEFRFHIEMETERLIGTKGLAPGEARRRALTAFGGVEKHKEALRDGRGLAWLGGLSLDLKLGLRTLARYPGVTVVGGLAMVIGVGLGAAYLEVMSDFLHPSLPFEDGKRIVGLQNWDLVENDPEPRAMHDFVQWRAELKSIEAVSAFRSIERNLGIGAASEPALGAAISPSAFRVVRVPALLGRTLIDDDERDGAPPVVVLGYQVWRSRFAADLAVVGRTVQIGSATTTVVGVMPEGFGFPVSHQFWVALRPSVQGFARREGPAIQIFGRLAPGVALADARAELHAVGQRAAADSPATHERLSPRVVNYTELFVGGEGTAPAYLVQFIFVMLLLVLSSNVATMVFARTATREHEIAMRFALGSSRGRILGQFFLEALVLALAATLAGLTIVSWGAGWVTRLVWDVTEGRVPFWLETGAGLNVTTVIYALLVAVVGSVVAGVMPALKVTGTRRGAQLRHAAGTGESGLRFGGFWSVMIVAQVAFAVLIMPPAIVAISSLAEPDHADPGFAAEQFLSARLEMDDDFAEFQRASEELRRRLVSDPQISGVTFANRLPNMGHPEPGIEVDTGGATLPASDELVMAASVGVDYFDTLGAGIVAGRGFSSADLRPGAAVVVVNQYFVEEVLEGRNAIGRRVRYSTREGERSATGQPRGLTRAAMREPGSWYEIVGVVRNLGMDTTRDAFASGRGPGIYHPLTRDALGAADAYSVRMAFRVQGDPRSFAPTVRALAYDVHPALRLHDVLPLDGPIDRASQGQRRVGRFFTWITALVAFLALLVSVAGTYSLLSFTVSRQTREIGIRIALGANPRRIIAGVFSRTMVQFGAGILIGAVTWFYAIVRVLGGGDRIGLLVATGIGLLLVALLACGLPVRRALRIEPTEALRNVG